MQRWRKLAGGLALCAAAVLSGLRKNLNSNQSCRIRKAAVQGRHRRLMFYSYREVDGIQRPEHDGGPVSKLSGSFTMCADESDPS